MSDTVKAALHLENISQDGQIVVTELCGEIICFAKIDSRQKTRRIEFCKLQNIGFEVLL